MIDNSRLQTCMEKGSCTSSQYPYPPTEAPQDPEIVVTIMPTESVIEPATTKHPTVPSTTNPSIDVITEVPTEEIIDEITEVPTEPYTTEEPPTDLVISSDLECELIVEGNWKSITVGDDLCNDMEEDLVISDYFHLEYIVIGKNSLMNIPQLILRNLPTFNSFTVGENSFANSNRVIIESNCIKNC